jgi:lipopolysaccharide export LptBFGC system permease protein LptF
LEETLMLRLVDRYLLGRATLTLVSIVGVLIAILIAFDMTNRIGDTLKHEAGFTLVLEYYWCRIPEFIVSVTTPAVLITCLVVCAPMLTRGEFIALSANGLSLQSATRSLLFLALVVGALSSALLDLVVPPFTARSEFIEDILEKQVRDGKCWKVRETGAEWFVAHALPQGEKRFDLEGVTIAPPGGGLITADRLKWDAGAWRLEGNLCVLSIDGEGRYRLETPQSLEMVGALRLPYDPEQLHHELLPAHTLTGRELIARGGHQNLSLVYGRWARMFSPLLALMAALPLFVRFANKNRLILGSVRAMAVAAVPTVLIGMSGVVSESTRSDPLLIAAGAVAVAVLPSLLMWLRWRL